MGSTAEWMRAVNSAAAVPPPSTVTRTVRWFAADVADRTPGQRRAPSDATRATSTWRSQIGAGELARRCVGRRGLTETATDNRPKGRKSDVQGKSGDGGR